MKTPSNATLLFSAAITAAAAFLLLYVHTMPQNTSNGIEWKQDSGGNFALHVSNQSLAIDPVDITIYIDGKTAVRQNFPVGMQDEYLSFRFSLPLGGHTIKMESQKGQAVLEERFEITGKHGAIVEYWYYPEGAPGSPPDPVPKKFVFTFGKDKPLLID